MKAHIRTLDIVRLTVYNKCHKLFGGAVMFEYMTVQEAAMLWELSERRVQKLCKENRIDGILNVNRVWLIPKTAKKPADRRRKSEKLIKN